MFRRSIRGLAIAKEIARQRRERAVQLDLVAPWRLVLEAVRDQDREIVVVALLLEEEALFLQLLGGLGECLHVAGVVPAVVLRSSCLKTVNSTR